jgi:hypothetical protein
MRTLVWGAAEVRAEERPSWVRWRGPHQDLFVVNAFQVSARAPRSKILPLEGGKDILFKNLASTDPYAGR